MLVKFGRLVRYGSSQGTLIAKILLSAFSLSLLGFTRIINDLVDQA